MSLTTPGSKRHRFRQWFSRSPTSDSRTNLLALSRTSTSQSIASATSTATQPNFQNQVLLLLSQQDQDTIRQNTVTSATGVDNSVQQALTATRQKQTICQEKGWVGIFLGQTVVLREKADNIVKWLDRSKQAEYVASDAAPVHVDLPWAGICLLLEAEVSEQSQMAALVLGLEITLYVWHRLQVYMAYWATLPTSVARNNFEACLVEFHTLILQFLAGAIRVYQKGGVGRALNATWRIEEVSTFENECNKIARHAEIEVSNSDRNLSAVDRTVLKQQQEFLRLGLKQLDAMHSTKTSINKSGAQLDLGKSSVAAGIAFNSFEKDLDLGKLSVAAGAAFDSSQKELDLGKLPIAAGAAFNSYQNELNTRCYPDTCRDLLKDISRWAEDADGEGIFWLNGIAGTGKSTISRTVAQMFADKGQLGASFFFTRTERDRKNASLFFSTIVHELVRHIPALMPHIHKTLDNDPRIARRALNEQFDKLIFQPLIDIGSTQAAKLFLVIDALDECDRDNVRIILPLLRRLKQTHIRVFLTSRPELPIHLGFAQMAVEKRCDVILHHIPSSTTQHDISVYLRDEFAQIRDNQPHLLTPDQSLDLDWPGTQALSTLTQLAVPLFVAAATICRFVGDLNGNPRKRLDKILDQPVRQGSLEQAYLPVLGQLLFWVEDASKEDQIYRNFRDIVGSIVLLANPLSALSLAKLLHIEKADVDDQLRCLHSVLWVPSDPNEPVHLLHLSFREFLVMKTHSDLGRQFSIDESASQGYLADKCLALLQGPCGLCKDICRLGRFGVQREEIDEATITKHIPPHLQYACRYWVYHLQHSSRWVCDGDAVDVFLRQRFLHWLEALSLTGRISESVEFINILQSLVEEDNSQVSLFLRDARRFVFTFNTILAQAPLQAYGAAWHFSPLKSIFKSTFRDQALQNIQVTKGVPEEWNACLLTYEGHSDAVNGAVFSPDGRRVASSSGDKTVRVWNVTTGECEHILRGHSGWVNSVTFSPDGKRVVTGSSDKTVRIWNTETGECEHIYSHSKGVYNVGFSPDGRRVVSGSGDKTVRVWHVMTGECVHTLEGHSDLVNTVTFSPDGRRAVSSSSDKTVRIWDTNTGECEHILEGHSDWATSVAFSPDGRRVASSSRDQKMRLWNAETGECEHILEGHSSLVNSVAFSPDGRLAVSGSGDHTVRLWNLETGECEHTLEGHSGWVNSVGFSPDGRWVVSSSHDKTVRVWEVGMGKSKHTLEGHSDWVNNLVFSPDGKWMASNPGNKTVQVWNMITGECEHIMKGHSKWIYSVVFSPDGRRVGSGSFDKTVRVWNITTGECERTFEGHSDWVYSVAFSPDGRWVVSSSSDKTVRVWNVTTGKCEHILEGHLGAVNKVVLSGDGRLVGSSSADKTVRIWDLATGTELLCHNSYAYPKTIQFSNDGTKIMVDGDLISVPSQTSLSNPIVSEKQFASILDVEVDGLEASGDWVTLCSEKILWLPPEYRPSSRARHNRAAVLFGWSGRVTFVYLSATSSY